MGERSETAHHQHALAQQEHRRADLAVRHSYDSPQFRFVKSVGTPGRFRLGFFLGLDFALGSAGSPGPFALVALAALGLRRLRFGFSGGASSSSGLDLDLPLPLGLGSDLSAFL